MELCYFVSLIFNVNLIRDFMAVIFFVKLAEEKARTYMKFLEICGFPGISIHLVSFVKVFGLLILRFYTDFVSLSFAAMHTSAHSITYFHLTHSIILGTGN